jgi:hypothetical protein
MQSSTLSALGGAGRRWAALSLSRGKQLSVVKGSPTGVPDCESASWYRFGTGCIVLFVQIVHGPGHIGNDGRSKTHRRLAPLGWGPEGR